MDAVLDDTAGERLRQGYPGISDTLSSSGRCPSYSSALKIASPGVQDFYQGTELWTSAWWTRTTAGRWISIPRTAFTNVKPKESRGAGPLIHDLLANWENGGLKLYLPSKAKLQESASGSSVCRGTIFPWGPGAQTGRRWSLLPGGTKIPGRWWWLPGFSAPCWRPEIWPSTRRCGEKTSWFCLQGAPGEWLNIFTHEPLTSLQPQRTRSLPLDHLLRNLPVALLSGPAV